MINGRDRCHISTSHTLLINTVINRGVCSLQCSPVGGYAQLPPLPTFLSLLPSNFLISFSLVFFFFCHFLPSAAGFLPILCVSMFFCLHFCHHRFHLYIFLFISVAAQSFISVFAFFCIYLILLPPLAASLCPSLFLSACTFRCPIYISSDFFHPFISPALTLHHCGHFSTVFLEFLLIISLQVFYPCIPLCLDLLLFISISFLFALHPPLYLCVSVFVSLSFFLLLSSLADPLYYSLFLSHLFLLSYFFDFPLCLSFTHFKLCICFPSPLLCILLPTFLSLSYSLPLPFSLSPSTPRLPLPVIPLFSMI